MKILAVIPTYNESDILPWTLKHLKEQGVEPYVIDNWSTDWDVLDHFAVAGWERFPQTGALQFYPWSQILERIEQIAVESDADWVLFNDADELRYSPRPGETLHDAFARISKTEYNCVDFKVLNFPPVDNEYSGDPERYFTHHEKETSYDRLPHIKAWEQYQMGKFRVNLHDTGGHVAQFPGMKIYPHKFISKHYPIRSQQHGERKVFTERRPRLSPQEQFGKQWHAQYDHVQPGYSFLKRMEELELFNTSKWFTDK